MFARSSLLMLIFGTGLGAVLLVNRAFAPTVHAQQRPAPGIDDARLAALSQHLRTRALSLKPGDIVKLSALGRPLAGAPEKTAPAPNGSRSKPLAGSVKKAPDAPANSSNKTEAADARKKTSTQRQEQTHASHSDAQARKPSFSPFPHGPRPHAPALPPGYHPLVRVSAPGRLDWTFVVSRQSLDSGPSAATAGYVSTRQSYELYVPPGYNPRQAYPMVLQVNTGPRSDGWVHWQNTCRSRRVIFAGVHNAGNNVSMETRARIVLDVLDDVRHRFHIDTDRTYITGMSGAGHAASAIAYALPELFGGHIAICGSWNLRVEQMCRQRVSERLSVAVLTGAMDFNRPELEREFYPILGKEHVRAQLHVYPGIGHAYPTNAQLDQVFQWVEAGLPQRRIIGALFPASRLVGAPSPEEWSAAVLLEAGQRMEIAGGEASALFELQAVVERWRGLPTARIAQQLLDEFDASSPVKSKDIFRTERLNFRYLQVKTFDGIVNAPPPPGYPVPRTNLVEIAIVLWQEVHDLAPANSAIAREAKARLAVLQKELGS